MVANDAQIYDCAVIGLGPAGMMTVWNLKKSGKSVIGIDRGKAYYQRIRLKPLDVANGFGGAGLFSDGKLSFYPAASKLWENMDYHILKQSYSILESLFMKFNYAIPKWKDSWTSTDYVVKEHTKINTVQYLDSLTCVNFVKGIYADISESIMLETEVVRIRCLNHDLFYVYFNNNKFIKTRSIVLATGKLGNTIMTNIDNVAIFTKFRAEGGIRVETDNCNFIPYSLKQLDYKYIERLPDGAEFRTFCCCKDGKVIESDYFHKKSYNGTITDSPTGQSNVGLTIRCENRNSILANELMSFFEKDTFLFQLSEQKKNYNLGDNIDYIVNNRIHCVLKDNDYHTNIYGPEIEYCGEYPIFDWKTLKIDNCPIWVVGDLSAQYRGIIAALLSGIYAALVLLKR